MDDHWFRVEVKCYPCDATVTMRRFGTFINRITNDQKNIKEWFIRPKLTSLSSDPDDLVVLESVFTLKD